MLTCIYLPASLLRWVLPPRPFGAGEGGGSGRSPACTWPLILRAAPLDPKPGVWELALCQPGSLPHPIAFVGRGPPHTHHTRASPFPSRSRLSTGSPPGWVRWEATVLGHQQLCSAGSLTASPVSSSLLGSGSVLAVTSRQRRCCHIQVSAAGSQGHRDGFWPQLSLRQSRASTAAAGLNAQQDWRGGRRCRMLAPASLDCSRSQLCSRPAWGGTWPWQLYRAREKLLPPA